MAVKTKFLTLYYRNPETRAFTAIPVQVNGEEIKLMFQGGIPKQILSMDGAFVAELKR